MVDGCPFCLPWDDLDVQTSFINSEGHQIAVIRPRDPVVLGHVLVITAEHSVDAASDPRIAAALMRTAAAWVRVHVGDANIIANVGAAAGQTVFHTHVHVVPRVPGDELLLPWSSQKG